MSKYPLNGKNYTKADDLEMMTHPNDWPKWPWLYVKRPGLDTGAVFADDTDPDPFVIREYAKAGNVKCTYPNAQAAIDDGWKVD